ncbi:MAG: SpoVR family protein [archaeon]
MKEISLPQDIKDSMIEVEQIARNGCNLDYFPVMMNLVDAGTLMEVASYTGMPKRFPHWRWGMIQKSMEKQQDWGLSRFYELVINTNPCIAYLAEENPLVVQTMVMAHVYGHADFFKNNHLFANTNRNMHNSMSDHAERVTYYQQRKSIGQAEVEKFLEVCFSLENLIDNYALVFDARPLLDDEDIQTNVQAKNEKSCCTSGGCGTGACGGCDDTPSSKDSDDDYRLRVDKPYMDSFINTPEFIEEMRQKAARKKEKKKVFPSIPQRDILRFLIKHSEGMTPWQKDLLSMIREEAYYFAPQRRTKIMNEGWAVYWHRVIMEDYGLAARDDFIHYAKVNAGVLAMPPGNINPYAVGYMLWNDIKERWDKGKHGKEYDREKNVAKRENWDTGEKKGLEKMFQVRESMDDLIFLHEFLTQEFLEKNKFYSFDLDQRDNWYKITSRETDEIRNRIMAPLINCGEPMIEVLDGNYNNAGELLLLHTSYDGRILEKHTRIKTLKNLLKVWGRPVHVITVDKEKPVIFSCVNNTIKKTQLT